MDWKGAKESIEQRLRAYEDTRGYLLGLKQRGTKESFVRQLLESMRRVRYVAALRERRIDQSRCDPRSSLFDPIKAAIFHQRDGAIDEAFWLTFLSVHFGKHRRDGWRLVATVYAGPEKKKVWTWKRLSRDPVAFRAWLAAAAPMWIRDGKSGRFGNHRKYESLDGHSSNGTGAVVASYVSWVGSPQSHLRRIELCNAESPAELFDELYRSLASVRRFGRTARFDYLTMLGKLGLAEIAPRGPYLAGATGPLRGARLLFRGSPVASETVRNLEPLCGELGASLGVGMQVIEDALCNWQKSPRKFTPFRG